MYLKQQQQQQTCSPGSINPIYFYLRPNTSYILLSNAASNLKTLTICPAILKFSSFAMKIAYSLVRICITNSVKLKILRLFWEFELIRSGVEYHNLHMYQPLSGDFDKGHPPTILGGAPIFKTKSQNLCVATKSLLLPPYQDFPEKQKQEDISVSISSSSSVSFSPFLYQ